MNEISSSVRPWPRSTARTPARSSAATATARPLRPVVAPSAARRIPGGVPISRRPATRTSRSPPGPSTGSGRRSRGSAETSASSSASATAGSRPATITGTPRSSRSQASAASGASRSRAPTRRGSGGTDGTGKHGGSGAAMGRAAEPTRGAGPTSIVRRRDVAAANRAPPRRRAPCMPARARERAVARRGDHCAAGARHREPATRIGGTLRQCHRERSFDHQAVYGASTGGWSPAVGVPSLILRTTGRARAWTRVAALAYGSDEGRT